MPASEGFAGAFPGGGYGRERRLRNPLWLELTQHGIRNSTEPNVASIAP